MMTESPPLSVREQVWGIFVKLYTLSLSTQFCVQSYFFEGYHRTLQSLWNANSDKLKSFNDSSAVWSLRGYCKTWLVAFVLLNGRTRQLHFFSWGDSVISVIAAMTLMPDLKATPIDEMGSHWTDRQLGIPLELNFNQTCLTSWSRWKTLKQ